jgi:16S rRNA pseudouridine516 synthase
LELERILRSQGFGSRPECRSLILGGRVVIGGNTCDNPFVDLDPVGMEFSVDGTPWKWQKSVYLLLNKPLHYECSQKPTFYPSVYSILPRPLVTRGVQAVGRLDEDTTGLLLLSDDGQFIHTYTSPKKKVSKVYEVTVKHPLDERQTSALLSGVQLLDEARAIAATACEVRSEFVLRMTVTEGKYHLVKRMIAAAGNRVLGLRRIAIGGLTLPDGLAEGQWRWLEEDELKQLAGAAQAS